MLTFLNVFLSIIFLLVIPVIIGVLICSKLHIPYSFANWFTMGCFSSWAVGQVILVPLILMDVSFTLACIVLLVANLLLIVYSLYGLFYLLSPNGRHSRLEFPKIKADTNTLLFGCLLLLVVFILFQAMMLQNTDADDSRFVVLAMDTVRSDRMLRTNPANGKIFTENLGDINKDFSSPWPVYVAYLSHMCGVKATVMFHTILPFALYILVTCCFWAVGDIFFKGDFESKCIFTIALWCLYIFGCYSEMGVETFVMSRIWQGKALVAGVGIPMLICSMIRIYRKPDVRAYVQLLIMNLGVCLLSGMGIVLGAMLMVIFGAVYAFLKKDYRRFLFPAMIAVINGGLYLINQNAVTFM